MGRTIAQAASRQLPTVAAQIRSQGQVFSEYLSFFNNSYSTNRAILINNNMLCGPDTHSIVK
jgi:hypothetical protein